MMIRVVLLLCFVFTIPAVVFSDDEHETIYEILQENGLPLGIFPKGVKDFSFNGETGRFLVHMNKSCDAKYETELHYDVNITGTLGYGEIKDLSGILAQDLFLWFPVKGIRVEVPSSGLIVFDVGVVRKQYSLSLFETPRDCVAVRGENKVQSSVLPLYQVVQTLGRDVV
ncbi:unnamed protein product [Eruca vesicaria subsp. sativa]|uniref:Uncharacterized protein n=1 Tax=Eruca vesicaria subsp. sativa TaxID=29727 RepID=A0ABC8KHK3_ERUVS|nr:unnamed protein product [Eruca vesicaria subsp. sativa]